MLKIFSLHKHLRFRPRRSIIIILLREGEPGGAQRERSNSCLLFISIITILSPFKDFI